MMVNYQNHKQAGIFCIVTLLVLIGCEPKIEGKPVSLELDDTRPILSIQVADADEAKLLVQKFGIEIVRMERGTVFFFEDADQLPYLIDLGYELKRQNAYELFRRVVRIDRTVSEDELIADGVRIINREKQYLIVDATISQLKALVRSGSRIVAISEHEPHPRQIRIIVGSMGDVVKVGAMNVDIYSAKPERKKLIDSQKVDRKINIVIYGGAFDYQIDQLKAVGYNVVIIPEPVPGLTGGQS